MTIIVKPNKQAAEDRQKKINEAKVKKLAKGQDSRKVHDTKGKNTHSRRY